MGTLFNKDATIDAIQREYTVKQSRVIKHLVKFIYESNSLSDNIQSNLIDDKKLKNRIFKCFDKHNTIAMKPTFEELHKTVDYDTVRLARLQYLIEKRNI